MKMKLLNKDEMLKWITFEMWDTDDFPIEEQRIALKWLWRVYDDIESGKVKEVDAIPVEWIERWIKEHTQLDYFYAVCDMCEDWSKENETM